jgi:hypothetical protein
MCELVRRNSGSLVLPKKLRLWIWNPPHLYKLRSPTCWSHTTATRHATIHSKQVLDTGSHNEYTPHYGRKSFDA